MMYLKYKAIKIELLQEIITTLGQSESSKSLVDNLTLIMEGKAPDPLFNGPCYFEQPTSREYFLNKLRRSISNTIMPSAHYTYRHSVEVLEFTREEILERSDDEELFENGSGIYNSTSGEHFAYLQSQPHNILVNLATDEIFVKHCLWQAGDPLTPWVLWDNGEDKLSSSWEGIKECISNNF